MSHSYLHNPVHVVFSTRERRKLIPQESKSHLWAYLAGICKKHRIFVHEIGGMEDHVHMLIEIPLTLAFSDAFAGDQDRLIPMDGTPVRLATRIRDFRRE